jgi:hypothetical protein
MSRVIYTLTHRKLASTGYEIRPRVSNRFFCFSQIFSNFSATYQDINVVQPTNNLSNPSMRFRMSHQPIHPAQHPPIATFTQNDNAMSNTLIICRIPRELNTEPKLFEHFQQFGKILNIKCNYEGNFDMAIVQFAMLNEAQSAYKCPQPLFNNRFIRLYWYNQKNKIRPRQQQSQQQVNFNAIQQTNVSMPSASNPLLSNMNIEDDDNMTNNYDDDESVARKKHVKERLEFRSQSHQADMLVMNHTEHVQNKENNQMDSNVICSAYCNCNSPSY